MKFLQFLITQKIVVPPNSLDAFIHKSDLECLYFLVAKGCRLNPENQTYFEFQNISPDLVSFLLKYGETIRKETLPIALKQFSIDHLKQIFQTQFDETTLTSEYCAHFYEI